MAIQTQRKLSELQKECKDKGLNVIQSGSRISKTDYVLALRDYYLKTLYPTGIPEKLKLMLEIESPMLCSRFTEFTPEEQEKMWNSKEWIASVKEDGARMILIISNGKVGLYSRNISVKNFLPVDYSDNVYFGNTDFSSIKDTLILDCEIVSTNPNINTVLGSRGCVTESQLQATTALLALNPAESIRIQKDEDCPLQFRTFDILYKNGWVIDKPYLERAKLLKSVLPSVMATGLNIVEVLTNYSNKKAFYKAIVAQGGEGVVLKNLSSPYVASSSRSKGGWVKVKRTMSESIQNAGLGDSIDCFVTGFEPGDETKGWKGLVGALEFSCYLRDKNGDLKPHVIAHISNLTMDLRKAMTEVGADGEPKLKSEWYGKCASVDGQAVSARVRALKHARLVDWRPDRSPETCIIDEDFLNSMIL